MEALTLGPTDKELVARINHGDRTAFEPLVRRYEGKLFRIAMRFVRNVSDAQDIVQLAFLNVWKHLGTYEGRAQVSSWIHLVAINTALMFLRARRRRPELSLGGGDEILTTAALADLACLPVPVCPPSPDDHAWAVELHRIAHSSVTTLPLELRQVFISRVLDGHSTDQTARLLGISQTVVKRLLKRARARLRRRLSPVLA